MLKLLACAGLLTLGLAVPTMSMEMPKCDTPTMQKMTTDMGAMTDPAMKDRMAMATKHMDMAMEAMKANKMDECSQHLNTAMMVGMAKCDADSLSQMQSGVEAMKDAAMKDSAMKEMDMAKTAMKDSKMDECKAHMGEVMKKM